MASYRLLAGQHIQDDPDWTPSDAERREADAQGRTPRNPGKTYKAGDVVESETDLAKRFGPEKFQLVGGEIATAEARVRELEEEVRLLRAEKAGMLGRRTPGDPTPENLERSPAVAPGGQVSTGKQASGGAFQGPGVRSGPLRPEDDVTVGGPADDGLDDKTVAELKDTAADEEIPLSGATKKDEIVAAIRKGRRH